MLNQIPKINFKLLSNENHIDYQREIDTLKKAVTDYGFLIIKNYPIDFKEINNVFDLYRIFFNQSLDEKDTRCKQMIVVYVMVSCIAWSNIFYFFFNDTETTEIYT